MGCSCSKGKIEEAAPDMSIQEPEAPVQQAMSDQVQQQAAALFSQISAAMTSATGQKSDTANTEKADDTTKAASTGLTDSVQVLFHDVSESLAGAISSQTDVKKKKKKNKKKGGKGNSQGGDASSGGDATPTGRDDVFVESVEPDTANPEAYYSAESEDPLEATKTNKSKKAARN